MAKFAAECIDKLNEVTEELSARLGSDTKDLMLRCGMHSGPTTGMCQSRSKQLLWQYNGQCLTFPSFASNNQSGGVTG